MSMPPSPPCARSTGNRSPSISSWCSRPTRSKARRTACSPRSNSPRAPRRSAKARCFRRCPIAIPLVTAIKVGDIVEAAKELLGKLMTAIGATAGVTLADRRRRACRRRRRRPGAAQISGGDLQDARRHARPHSPRRAARIRPARHRHGAAGGGASPPSPPGRSANGRSTWSSCSRRLPPSRPSCSPWSSCW